MFSIQDFLIFIGEPEAKRPKYSMIAAGVLALVSSVYKIELEPSVRTSSLYFTDGLTYQLEVSPVSDIVSIKYNNVEQDFTYNQDTQTITLATRLSDVSIPLEVKLEIGYKTIPYDLKMAIYYHIQHVYYMNENNMTNILKVINTTGNTVYYRDEHIPDVSRTVYDFYSRRQLIV